MLKTALKPRWIAALLLAFAVASVFVLLSKWQLDRSEESVDQPRVTTEETKPLTDILTPGMAMTQLQADHVVSLSGEFMPDKQVLVKDRLLNGQSGYWVLTAFKVTGAPVVKGEGGGSFTVIPIARGWVADPGQAPTAPSGTLTITGRLLPSESPQLEKNLPAGQVATASTAELINIWNIYSYQGMVVSFSEVGASGDVGAHAVRSDLKGISVGPQPIEKNFNWLNIFYAVEWFVFAGFAVFLWWRLVADDYRRQQEELEDAALEATAAQAHEGQAPEAQAPAAQAPAELHSTDVLPGEREN